MYIKTMYEIWQVKTDGSIRSTEIIKDSKAQADLECEYLNIAFKEFDTEYYEVVERKIEIK